MIISYLTVLLLLISETSYGKLVAISGNPLEAASVEMEQEDANLFSYAYVFACHLRHLLYIRAATARKFLKKSRDLHRKSLI